MLRTQTHSVANGNYFNFKATGTYFYHTVKLLPEIFQCHVAL